MSKSKLFDLIEKTPWHAIPGICAEYEKKIADLERNNLLLADQIKKREGIWLAPDEADEGMIKAGCSSWLSDAGQIIYPEQVYKAMRDNWLSRNK